MSGGRKAVDPEREARLEHLMRRVAIAVLAVGLAVSTLIFLLSPADVPVDAATASIQDSRQYQLALERIGGKAAVFAAQFSDWLAGLWHGRRLAGTVALLSLAVSGLCYAVSRPPR